MTPSHTLFFHWILILLSLANRTQGQRMPLFERSAALCGSSPAAPRLCTSASKFETCTTKGDPCGKNGLCVRTTEGEPICATDGLTSICFGSEYCWNGEKCYGGISCVSYYPICVKEVFS